MLTTVNALVQYVPPRHVFEGAALTLRVGRDAAPERIIGFLEANGYNRAGTVMEPGEYATRGGILDLFPAGEPDPVRVDLFGDTIESLRRFDPTSQRSTTKLKHLIRKGPVGWSGTEIPAAAYVVGSDAAGSGVSAAMAPSDRVRWMTASASIKCSRLHSSTAWRTRVRGCSPRSCKTRTNRRAPARAPWSPSGAPRKSAKHAGRTQSRNTGAWSSAPGLRPSVAR